MRPRLSIRLGAWLPALALASGCSWISSTVEVRVRTPAPPESWREAFPGLLFELSCPEGDPALCCVAPGGEASLHLPKRANWPVLACPRARGARLAPAGGLYPLDLDAGGDRLQLRWEHGPAAEVFLALIREGFEVGRVNARRLVEEMLARSSGDPWRLDLPVLAGCLAGEEFRVTDIRLLPARDVTLEVAPGTWLLESPFRPAQCIAAGEALHLPALSLGAHRLFAVELPGGFTLYVSEREVLLLPLSGD